MKIIIQKGRFLFLLIQAILSRYSKIVIIGFLIGAIFCLVGLRLRLTSFHLLFPKKSIIGIIGSYSPTNLPISLQNLLSFGLVTLDVNGDLKPGIAESWQVTESGKLYRFNLKQDLVWHDGTSFDASLINYVLKDIEEMTVVNNYTYEIKLKESFSPLLTLLNKPIFKQGLIGLGPYKVASIKFHGDKVESINLTPMSNKQPLLEYKFYPTEAAAVTAFKLGEIDYLDNISDIQDLKTWKNIKIDQRIDYNKVLAVFYNTKNSLLQDKKIRQALNYSIEPFNDQVKAKSPLSLKSWAYYDQTKSYEFNLTKALEIFEEEGIATVSAKLTLSTFFPYLDVAQKIAKSWEQLGIKVQVKVENSLPSSFDALLTLREIPPDPDQYLFWHSTQQANITKISSLKIDKLLEDGRTRDKKERLEIYHDFQRYLSEEAPAAFLYYPKVYTISRK